MSWADRSPTSAGRGFPASGKAAGSDQGAGGVRQNLARRKLRRKLVGVASPALRRGAANTAGVSVQQWTGAREQLSRVTRAKPFCPGAESAAAKPPAWILLYSFNIHTPDSRNIHTPDSRYCRNPWSGNRWSKRPSRRPLRRPRRRPSSGRGLNRRATGGSHPRLGHLSPPSGGYGRPAFPPTLAMRPQGRADRTARSAARQIDLKRVAGTPWLPST
jgi:hypothetical protein